MLSTSGQAKLANFGIARDPVCTPTHDIHTKMYVETTLCMSPERLRGDCHAFSADIWSLGLVLVEAAVGNHSLAQLVPQAGESYETLEDELLGSARTHKQQAPSRFSAEVLSSHGNTQWQARKVLSCACLLASASKRPRAQAATILSTASSQVLIVSGSSNSCCSAF